MEYLLFTEREILELVDEYQLYCFYLKVDLEIGLKYPTPDTMRSFKDLPPDRNPSIAIFLPKIPANTPKHTEFLFKEHSMGVTGDIFKLVQYIHHLESRQLAMRRVCEDFGLGGAPKITVPNLLPNVERRYAEPVHIQIKSRPFNTRDFLYWDRYNVSHEILIQYHVKAIQAYWLAVGQEVPGYPSGLGYAYEIDSRYQLYFPYTRNSKKKFRMNWGPYDIPGFYQLSDQRELLIITKSMKDVMCLRSYGYDAIACKGENALISEECMAWCRANYKRIIILFDNDGKTKAAEYPEEKIWIPKELPTDKDISDYTDNHSPKEAQKLLKSLIWGTQ